MEAMDAVDHALCAELELLGALAWVPRTSLTWDEWTRLLSVFTPRYRRVVILHGIRGLTFAQVGALLGITRSRADQIWRESLPKLKSMQDTLERPEPERSARRLIPSRRM